MIRILITGGTGAVGERLVSILAQNNDAKVLLIVRSIENAQLLFGNKPNLGFTTIKNHDVIQNFDPNYVIHLASFVTSACDIQNGEKLVESNILFGIELFEVLRSCKKIKCFFNFGTFAEFKMGPEKVENAYLYSASKSAFKAFAEFYCNLGGYNLIHFIPYTIYGTKDSKKKIIDHIYDSFFSSSPIAMTPGYQILDFIHVDDICQIILNCINNSKINSYHQQNIHLGTGVGTSIRQVVNLMAQILDRKPNISWGALNYRDMDVMYAVANISKLIEMNSIPKIRFEDGLLEYINLKG
jgi:nucleoside-diphosphate-sugar epimerase